MKPGSRRWMAVRSSWMLIAGCGAALLLASCASAPPAPPTTEANSPIDRLGWMAGAWRTDEPQPGTWTQEHWMSPAGGSMLGMSRTIADGRTTFFEYLRVESREDGVYYIAHPLGQAGEGGEGTAFKLIESSARQAVFENPQHDFPTRIIYTRDGHDRLRARIEGTQHGRPAASEWVMRRQRSG